MASAGPLDWLISWKDYKSFLKAADESKLKKWEPKFKPRIEFVNAVETHSENVVEYGHKGCYRVLHYKDWLEDTCPQVDCAYFQRMRLECDLTLSEQMELVNFPMDCQDFSLVIQEASGTKKVKLLPEPRYFTSQRKKHERSNWFSLDPTYSVLDEWDFMSTRLEFGSTASGASRSKTAYDQLNIRYKMRRKWVVYFWNVVFYFMIITWPTANLKELLVPRPPLHGLYSTSGCYFVLSMCTWDLWQQ